MTTWQSTRRDLKKFLDDVRDNPGKTYYAISECTNPLNGEDTYREITFKPSRLWVGVWGHHSAEAVLSHYGPLSDVEPNELRARPLFGSGGATYPPDVKPAPAPKRRGALARR
ncbi:hypothetical protein [Streptomyces sp. NPDC088258]|uniref:hypothetical protein n=1 Tax=Streptomyces sp. NPDC088258 TaxID=3365849 RepID=UPI00380206BE